MISLPLHTTRKLQPLDVAFFKPFNTYYDQHVQRWLHAHPGRGFGEFQVSLLTDACADESASADDDVTADTCADEGASADDDVTADTS